MTLSQLKQRAMEDIANAHHLGWRNGLRDAASRFRVIAAEVHVSAEQLRAEIEAEAKRLEQLGREP